MTEAEFNEKECWELLKVPEEFRSIISQMAYQRGHSAGMEEVLLLVQELVGDLLPAINTYKQNLLKNK